MGDHRHSWTHYEFTESEQRSWGEPEQLNTITIKQVYFFLILIWCPNNEIIVTNKLLIIKYIKWQWEKTFRFCFFII